MQEPKADSMLSIEPNMGLDPMTVGSRPELKPGVPLFETLCMASKVFRSLDWGWVGGMSSHELLSRKEGVRSYLTSAPGMRLVSSLSTKDQSDRTREPIPGAISL